VLEFSDHFGLAGSIVSAILQASGLITLQAILVQATGFIRALGALLFVVAAVVLISRVAMGGTLREGILLIISPILGLAVCFTTVTVNLEEQRKLDGVTIESGVTAMVGEAKNIKEIDVPLFIMVVNKVSRSVVNQLSSFILSDGFRSETVRAARDRLMSRLLLAENIDASYKLLLAKSLSGDCAQITSYNWELSREQYVDALPGSINANMAAGIRAKRNTLSLKRHRLHQREMDYLNGLGLSPVEAPTCDEVWLYTRDASYRLAQAMLDNASIYREEFPELTDSEWVDVLSFVKEKLAPENTTAVEWNQAYRILAAFLLRNTLANTAHGSSTDNITSRSEWKIERDDEDVETYSALNSGIDSIRLSVVRFSAAVPYVQGLCMYLLLASFPFFCLLMIFPRQVGALGIWVSLWIWLLSWEVGFAIVAQIKEILWASLPHVGDTFLESTGADRLTTIDWADPASMFTLLNIESPERQFQTYYGLIAMLTLTIPIFAGYCFQAASQVADIISRAMRAGGRP